MLTWLFTVSTSLMMGALASLSFFDSTLQLLYYFDVTLIIIFALIFSLILYAFQTIYDFNIGHCLKYIIVIIVVFIGIYSLMIPLWSFWLAGFLPTVFFSGLSALFYSIVCVFLLQICSFQVSVTNLSSDTDLTWLYLSCDSNVLFYSISWFSSVFSPGIILDSCHPCICFVIYVSSLLGRDIITTTADWYYGINTTTNSFFFRWQHSTWSQTWRLWFTDATTTAWLLILSC